MRFLLDQHLPIRLCGVLHALGYEALHVEALGLADSSDFLIWTEAQRLDAIVVSKDSDFLSLVSSGGRLVRVRVGNRPNRELYTIVERAWPKVVERLAKGERVVELRG